MSLRSTPVSKCLDKKLLLFGFEVPDVLAIFLTLSVLSFVFGQQPFKAILVLLPTAALALLLHIKKKGKPDNYLVHWIRFQVSPGSYRAFPEATQWVRPPKLKILKGDKQ